MLAKLGSRKFIITVLTAALLAASDQLGIDHAVALDITGVISVYLGVQGAHDVVEKKYR